MDDKKNAIWQLAASGSTPVLLAAMGATGRIATNAAVEKDSFAQWMQVQTAQAGSLNAVYPLSVFFGYLEHIDGFDFNRARLFEDSAPPANTNVSGSTVTCSSDATAESRQPVLSSWNYVVFTESEIVGSESAGVWTFPAVQAGVYVVSFDGSLPSLYITVD